MSSTKQGEPSGSAPGAPIIHLHGVSRVEQDGAADVRALDGIDLTVESGEFVAVMGPSGSGKSTLLDIIGGLRRPSEGTVTVDGIDVAGATAACLAALRRTHVGYVFQDLNLISALTAAENVALPLDLDDTPATKSRRAAHDALTECGVAELAERYPDEMSGGQRQRVAIARALVGERSILLADEPTGALDSVTGEAVLELLRRRADSGATVLLVTHEQRFAGWADRVVFLRDGRVDTRGESS